MLSVIKAAAIAGSYGEMTIRAIDSDWTLDTIKMYAKFAVSYANMALTFAEDYELKRSYTSKAL